MSLEIVPSEASANKKNCFKKNKGDSNCDGSIDLIDFEMWRREYKREVFSKNSDFNQDRKISMLDFVIWRKNYIYGK